MNYKQICNRNNLSAITLWIMALDCAIFSFLYNPTSHTVGVVFGLTIISGIFFVIKERHEIHKKYWDIIKSTPTRIGSLIVISAIILYTFIPAHIRFVISIIILVLGLCILLYSWVYAILFGKTI